jgi:hypothetical protein
MRVKPFNSVQEGGLCEVPKSSEPSIIVGQVVADSSIRGFKPWEVERLSK